MGGTTLEPEWWDVRYWGPITYNTYVLVVFPKVEYLQERERQGNLTQDYQNKISDLAHQISEKIKRQPVTIEGFHETVSGKRYAFSRVLESDLKADLESKGSRIQDTIGQDTWILTGDYRSQVGQVVITTTLLKSPDKVPVLLTTKIDQGSIEDAWLKQETTEDTDFFLRHEEERKLLTRVPEQKPVLRLFSGYEAQGNQNHTIPYFNYLGFQKFSYTQQITNIDFPPTAIVSTSKIGMTSGLGIGAEYQINYTSRLFFPIGAEFNYIPNDGLLSFTAVHLFSGTGIRVSRNLSVAGTVGYARWGFNFDAFDIEVASGNSFPLRLTARYAIIDSTVLFLGYQLWKINPPSEVTARQVDNGQGNGGTITDKFMFSGMNLSGLSVSLGMFF